MRKVSKPKARRHSFTRSKDEVYRILKKEQVIGYSSDLVSFVLTGQASMPYKGAGTHLERSGLLRVDRTSFDAI